METALVFIALFAAMFGIMYMYYSTRHKERIALIEKGADASLFNTGKEKATSSFSWSKFSLKTGMLFIGVGLGVIAGAICESAAVFADAATGYVSMIFIFGGLSLVLFYILDRKLK